MVCMSAQSKWCSRCVINHSTLAFFPLLLIICACVRQIAYLQKNKRKKNLELAFRVKYFYQKQFADVQMSGPINHYLALDWGTTGVTTTTTTAAIAAMTTNEK